jgi:hypothetical protein
MRTLVDAPWSGRAFKALVGADIAVVTTIVVSWYVASGSDRSLQVPGINLAIAALCLSAVGHGLWFLQGRRAVGLLRAELLPSTLLMKERTAASTRDEALPVAAPEMILYHRADCLLVAGKRVAPATVADHQRAGRAECGVCQP